MKYAKVKLKRLNDFDGEPCFAVLLNDETTDVDEMWGIHIFPQSFDIGQEVQLICVSEDRLIYN